MQTSRTGQFVIMPAYFSVFFCVFFFWHCNFPQLSRSFRNRANTNPNPCSYQCCHIFEQAKAGLVKKLNCLELKKNSWMNRPIFWIFPAVELWIKLDLTWKKLSWRHCWVHCCACRPLVWPCHFDLFPPPFYVRVASSWFSLDFYYV